MKRCKTCENNNSCLSCIDSEPQRNLFKNCECILGYMDNIAITDCDCNFFLVKIEFLNFIKIYIIDNNSYFDQNELIIKDYEDDEDYLYIWITLSTIIVIIVWILIGLKIRERYKNK